MNPDDLWIGLAQFDTRHADGLWDPNAATGAADNAPAWYGRVATLLRSAQAPATSDELAGEADIVARMQAAALDPAGAATHTGADRALSTDDGRPRHLRAASGAQAPGHRHRGARVVGRIVAVKAAAVTTAVAVGVTAAAATTGIVATVVVPALSDRDQPVSQEERPPPADGGGSTTGRGGGSSDGGSGGDPSGTLEGVSSLACIVRPDCDLADPEDPAPTPDPDATATDGEVTTDGTAVDGVAPEAEVPEPGSTPDTTAVVEPPPTSEPPPTTTTTTEPPPTTTTTEPPLEPLDEGADGGDQPPGETMRVPLTDVATGGVPADTVPASSPAG